MKAFVLQTSVGTIYFHSFVHCTTMNKKKFKKRTAQMKSALHPCDIIMRFVFPPYEISMI